MKKSFFLLSLLTFLFSGCENKYDWTNPLDQESEVLPEDWAPRNLRLQKISDTQIRLTWEQDEKRIEGFAIERKTGPGSWQRIAQLGANDRSYSDSELDMKIEYSYRICAYNSNRQSAFIEELSILDGELVKVVIKDIDGNVYKTIKIGNQWWMTENLKVTRYRNGDIIPNVTDNSQWANLSTGARCAYNNDNNNVATYGLLYNWYAVNDSRGLAPAGWRVPTDADWQKLVDYLGGNSVAGGKLKATSGWSSNGNGSNESGFTALPGGYRLSSNGTFYSIGNYGFWWSSTEYSSPYAWGRYLYYNYSGVYRSYYNKRNGFSVRCVRD